MDNNCYLPSFEIYQKIVQVVIDQISFSILCSTQVEIRRATTLIGEREVLKFIKDKIDNVSVFYDIGANIGTHSLLVSSLSPLISVYSFEPESKNFNSLMGNIYYNKADNVFPYNFGLGSRNSDEILFLSGPTAGEGGHTLISNSSSYQQSIAIFTLDYIVDSKNLPDPQFIKIDVEGYELEVLKGMVELIQRCHPTLLIEVHPTSIEKLYSDSYAVEEFLISKGYRLEQLDKLPKRKQTFIYAYYKETLAAV